VVRLGGHDLRQYRLDDLRGRIALVAQDTYLFNDTLRANIRLARPAASDADVAAAVHRPSQCRQWDRARRSAGLATSPGIH
jgi:ATP-binding cassette subfamily C protein CydCD